MNVLLLISCFSYTVLILLAVAGVFRLRFKKRTPIQNPENGPKITVVIPFRNEADKLPNLIDDLINQVPSGVMEVIGVDDHSGDDSLAVFKSLAGDRSQFHALSLTNETGKKNALALGINRSSGDYIATLDADVRISENWQDKIHQAIVANDYPDMVILPLKIGDGIQNRTAFFQRAENMAIQGLGYGLAAFNFPITCNGANLVFKKTAYAECDGYESHLELASGDDVFLMQQMVKNHKRVLPLLDASVVAEVKPVVSLRDFFNQRLRWAGKTGAMNLWATRLVGIILIIFTTAIIVSSVTPNNDWMLWTAVLAWKVIIDVVLIKITETTYNLRLNPLKLALVAIGYTFYMPLISLMRIWWKPTWKGRQI